MRKALMLCIAMVGLNGCVSSADRYCAGQIDPNDPMYIHCVGHYKSQEIAFDADKDMCETIADMSYPESMASMSRIEPQFGTSYVNGRFTPTEQARFEPNERTERQFAKARAKIVYVCMAKMGWNSAVDWKKGHRKIVCSGKNKLRLAKVTIIDKDHPHRAKPKTNTVAAKKEEPAKHEGFFHSLLHKH